MKLPVSLFVVPILIFTTACSSHYSVSSHHHARHHGHVSVGVHSHSRGDGAKVLGALIVGGLIGHALSEANKEEERVQRRVVTSDKQTDEMVNGYPIDSLQVQPEKNEEQNRYYQIGQDGNCYLMESKKRKEQIVAAVPKFSCE